MGWYAKLDAWEALALAEEIGIDLSQGKGSKAGSVHIRWKPAGPQARWRR